MGWDEFSARVYQDARNAALRRIAATDARIDEAIVAARARLREQLRDQVPPAELGAAIERALEPTRREIESTIARSVEEAAREGWRGARRVDPVLNPTRGPVPMRAPEPVAVPAYDAGPEPGASSADYLYAVLPKTIIDQALRHEIRGWSVHLRDEDSFVEHQRRAVSEWIGRVDDSDPPERFRAWGQAPGAIENAPITLRVRVGTPLQFPEGTRIGEATTTRVELPGRVDLTVGPLGKAESAEAGALDRAVRLEDLEVWTGRAWERVIRPADETAQLAIPGVKLTTTPTIDVRAVLNPVDEGLPDGDVTVTEPDDGSFLRPPGLTRADITVDSAAANPEKEPRGGAVLGWVEALREFEKVEGAYVDADAVDDVEKNQERATGRDARSREFGSDVGDYERALMAETISQFREAVVTVAEKAGFVPHKGRRPTPSPLDGLVVRGRDDKATTDAANGALAEITKARPDSAWRGMTAAEFEATIARGVGVLSRGDYSARTEGTQFAADAATAESYANTGRDDPRATGRPTYLVEVDREAAELRVKPDGYLEAPTGEAVDPDYVRAIWRFDRYPSGEVAATRLDPDDIAERALGRTTARLEWIRRALDAKDEATGRPFGHALSQDLVAELRARVKPTASDAEAGKGTGARAEGQSEIAFAELVLERDPNVADLAKRIDDEAVVAFPWYRHRVLEAFTDQVLAGRDIEKLQAVEAAIGKKEVQRLQNAWLDLGNRVGEFARRAGESGRANFGLDDDSIAKPTADVVDPWSWALPSDPIWLRAMLGPSDNPDARNTGSAVQRAARAALARIYGEPDDPVQIAEDAADAWRVFAGRGDVIASWVQSSSELSQAADSLYTSDHGDSDEADGLAFNYAVTQAALRARGLDRPVDVFRGFQGFFGSEGEGEAWTGFRGELPTNTASLWATHSTSAERFAPSGEGSLIVEDRVPPRLILSDYRIDRHLANVGEHEIVVLRPSGRVPFEVTNATYDPVEAESFRKIASVPDDRLYVAEPEKAPRPRDPSELEIPDTTPIRQLRWFEALPASARERLDEAQLELLRRSAESVLAARKVGPTGAPQPSQASRLAEVVSRMTGRVLRDTAGHIEPSRFGGIERAAPGLALPTEADALELASLRIRGGLSVDGVALSPRLHRVTGDVAARMAAQITASLRAGEGMARLTDRILEVEVDQLSPRIVASVTETIDAVARDLQDARLLDPAAEAGARVAAWNRLTREISRMGEGRADGTRTARSANSLRAATEALREELFAGDASDEAIDRAIERWLVERARYQARVIARTETIAAFDSAYMAGAASRPWVVGWRWRLSPRHPRPDICDLYARQDLHGFGPGGYPKRGEGEGRSALPKRHPQCLCVITPILDPHWRRRRRGEDAPEPWKTTPGTRLDALDAMPAELRAEVLGDGRLRWLREVGAKLSRSEVEEQLFDADGDLVPLYVLRGEAPPDRSLGRRLNVASLVRRDYVDVLRQAGIDLAPEIEVERPEPVPVEAAAEAAKAEAEAGPAPEADAAAEAIFARYGRRPTDAGLPQPPTETHVDRFPFGQIDNPLSQPTAGLRDAARVALKHPEIFTTPPTELGKIADPEIRARAVGMRVGIYADREKFVPELLASLPESGTVDGVELLARAGRDPLSEVEPRSAALVRRWADGEKIEGAERRDLERIFSAAGNVAEVTADQIAHGVVQYGALAAENVHRIVPTYPALDAETVRAAIAAEDSTIREQSTVSTSRGQPVLISIGGKLYPWRPWDQALVIRKLARSTREPDEFSKTDGLPAHPALAPMGGAFDAIVVSGESIPSLRPEPLRGTDAMRAIRDGVFEASTSTEGQARLRETLRRVIRGLDPSLRSNDTGATDRPRGQSPAVGFEVVAGSEGLAWAGGVHGWNGDVRLADHHWRQLLESTYHRDWSDGVFPSGNAADATKVLIHEELHGFDATTGDTYRGRHTGITEAAVEVAARRVHEVVLGEHGRRDVGAYQNQITAIESVLADTLYDLSRDKAASAGLRAALAGVSVSDPPSESTSIRQRLMEPWILSLFRAVSADGKPSTEARLDAMYETTLRSAAIGWGLTPSEAEVYARRVLDSLQGPLSNILTTQRSVFS